MIDLTASSTAVAQAKQRAYALANTIITEVISRGGRAADLVIEERGTGYVVLASGRLGPHREFGTVGQPELRLVTQAISTIRAGGVL